MFPDRSGDQFRRLSNAGAGRDARKGGAFYDRAGRSRPCAVPTAAQKGRRLERGGGSIRFRRLPGDSLASAGVIRTLKQAVFSRGSKAKAGGAPAITAPG